MEPLATRLQVSYMPPRMPTITATIQDSPGSDFSVVVAAGVKAGAAESGVVATGGAVAGAAAIGVTAAGAEVVVAGVMAVAGAAAEVFITNPTRS